MSPSRRKFLTATFAVGTAGIAGCVGSGDTPSGDQPNGDGNTTTDDGEEIHASYETTEVSAESDGKELGSVTAAIADTQDLRFTGLSNTKSLPEDRGMLFVFETADSRTFVMREMDFPIDIVYADVDGTITEIHHAPEPGPNEDGENQRYPGFGQYVLEVNYDWTTDRGIEVGDRLVFDL
ncbi:DUF192 domain-containing protein [Halovenus sp. HT40]|uniref:DUF192 domain-containing protein n=1 Tax=Halovenus sp. HT40 TaxID=3126691 RepID=UPI00300EC0B9